MARSAKTNHVMSLVGEPKKRTALPKTAPRHGQEEKARIKTVNPSLLPVESVGFAEGFEEKPHTENGRVFPPSAAVKTAEKDIEVNPENNGASQADLHGQTNNGKQEEPPLQSDLEQKPKACAESNPEVKPQTGSELKPEIKPEKPKGTVTAIVLELINQELDAIVKRFKINPTDNNLWRLTKAALESIRPEFSLNERDYEEKCVRLRQKVILEMTKAAIGISKSDRNK